MPRWAQAVLVRVRRLAGAGLIRFTYKARTELTELALDEEDAAEVIAGLSAREVVGRLWAEPPGAWLYVFRSSLEGASLYIKLALRGTAWCCHSMKRAREVKTKVPRRPERPRRRALPLPDDACPTCGTMMRSRRAPLSLPVNGEPVEVPDVEQWYCGRCGEIVLDFPASRAFGRAALEIYRGRYGLLSADEIREIRERLGLAQADLARLLRLGSNTISRWEAGRNVQTGAMDALLRLIRDVRGALAYLRKRA